MDNRLVVLDGPWLVCRAHFAGRAHPLIGAHGDDVSGLVGTYRSVVGLERSLGCSRSLVVAWDCDGATWRNLLSSEYKSGRGRRDEDLSRNLRWTRRLLAEMGIPVIASAGYEADDIMASLSFRCRELGREVVLVAADKDMDQLVGPLVSKLTNPALGEAGLEGEAEVVAKWGVSPPQVRDVLALMGDAVDDVSGVPGVGRKTATALIQAFGSVHGVYEKIEQVRPDGLRDRLIRHRPDAELSSELVGLVCDVSGCDVESRWERRWPNQTAIESLCQESGIECALGYSLDASARPA